MRWRISWLKKPWVCKTSIGQMQSQLIEEERLLLIFCCPEIFGSISGCEESKKLRITKESFEGTIDEHLYVWH